MEGHPLTCFGSQRDIAPIKDQLGPEMRIVIYMTGELEMEAIMESDSIHGHWIARPIPRTLKIYPEAFGSDSD
jgi:hypothetical protein